MEAVIVSVILFIAILLVLVILAQNSKGGGLTSQFGGSGASSMIGVKKTSDLLEKITWGLAISMLVLTLAINVIDDDNNADPFLDKVPEQGPSLNLDPSVLDDGTTIEGSDILDQLESSGDSTN